MEKGEQLRSPKRMPKLTKAMLFVLGFTLFIFVLLSLFVRISSIPTGPYTSKTTVRFVNPIEPKEPHFWEAEAQRRIDNLDFIADGNPYDQSEYEDFTEVTYEVLKVYKGKDEGKKVIVRYKEPIDSENEDMPLLIQAYEWSDDKLYGWPENKSFSDVTTSESQQNHIRERLK